MGWQDDGSDDGLDDDADFQDHGGFERELMRMMLTSLSCVDSGWLCF